MNVPDDLFEEIENAASSRYVKGEYLRLSTQKWLLDWINKVKTLFNQQAINKVTDPEEGKITGLKFGDLVENYHANETNPHRTGIFIKYVRGYGRDTLRLTDGHGDFWNLLNDKHAKTVKIGSVIKPGVL